MCTSSILLFHVCCQLNRDLLYGKSSGFRSLSILLPRAGNIQHSIFSTHTHLTVLSSTSFNKNRQKYILATLTDILHEYNGSIFKASANSNKWSFSNTITHTHCTLQMWTILTVRRYQVFKQTLNMTTQHIIELIQGFFGHLDHANARCRVAIFSWWNVRLIRKKKNPKQIKVTIYIKFLSMDIIQHIS